MIPDLVTISGAPWEVLPPGIHSATFSEISVKYGFNEHRREQLAGLFNALNQLASAGCRYVYLDGSFVTSKPLPGDYDCCWNHEGMDPNALNPVFLDFTNKRERQKSVFLGEFFPAYSDAGNGQIFIEFFQIEKHTGVMKGILLIDLVLGLGV